MDSLLKLEHKLGLDENIKKWNPTFINHHFLTKQIVSEGNLGFPLERREKLSGNAKHLNFK